MRKFKFFMMAVVFVALLGVSAHAIGITTAAFVPRNGALSHPISPLSFRDLGVKIGSYLGVSGSLSLYGINGMGIAGADGLPITLESPAAGPFYTILGSVVAKAIIPVSIIVLEPAGGVFGYYLINPALRSGAIDSYIAGESGYETVDSAFSVNGKWGWGYVFGGSLTVMVTEKIGIQAGALYYIGSSALELTGTYKADGLVSEDPVPAYLTGALLDFTGLEISIGVNYEL